MSIGDGESQPVEGVDSLSDLAEMMEAGEENEAALDESEQDEESDESEDVEGDEEAEESDEDDEQKEEPTFTVKVNGKDVVLKQSEMVEMASKGADYTQKTMAVAEERKAVEQVKSQAEHYRQQNEQALGETVNRLQAFSDYMQSQLGDPPPIEWASQDANYYLVQKEQYEARKGQLHQAQAAIQHLQGEAQRQRQAWITQQADATEQALRDTLPGWNDNTLTELAEYAAKHGLNPQTVDVAFVQKGLWQLAHKAKAYDALVAKKAELKPRTQLARVQKPAASNQPNRASLNKAAAEKRFAARPGSIDALADLIG